jgi:hypothetical protein
MNLANFLTDTASCIPDHPGICFEAQSITFAEMSRRVDALAHGHSSRAAYRSRRYCIECAPPFPWYGKTHSLNTSVYLGLTMHRWTRLEAEAEIDFPSKEVVLWKML